MSSRITYANVMASIAVFVALGGASYAALSLPGNSVGAKQLRPNAVTSSKVKNGSLQAADFATGQLLAGPAGPMGATGPAGPKGGTGPKGDTGPAVFPDVLASGKTETGSFAAQDTATTGPQVYASISFPVPLSAAPTPHIIASGSTAQCPGSATAPTAAAGQLCIYVVDATGTASDFSPSTGMSGDAGKTGVVVSAVDSTDAYVYGTWAVTAP